jgi:hypothetical protein
VTTGAQSAVALVLPAPGTGWQQDTCGVPAGTFRSRTLHAVRRVTATNLYRAAIGLCLITSPAPAAEPVVVTMPLIRADLLDHPTDWQGSGRLRDLLAAAWPAGRVEIRYQFGIPFERAMVTLQARDGGAVCAPFVRQTPDRAATMQFTRPLLESRPVAVLHRASDARPAAKRSLPELLNDPGLTLVMRKGSRFGEEIDRLLAAHPPATALMASAATAPHEMVCTDRGDYRLVDSRHWRLNSTCSNGEVLAVTLYPEAPMIAAEGLACSPSTPRWLLDAVDEQLQPVPAKGPPAGSPASD